MRERPPLDRVLDAYRGQILRWNSQINLVSRKDTAETLEKLILQCRHSWKRLSETEKEGFSPHTRLWYFDLGSGAGFPGFIWHLLADAAGVPAWTRLVEPREKRAWFLDRLNGLEGVRPLGVLAGRWGDPVPPDAAPAEGLADPTHILISLKALHLTDTQILAGLVPFLPPAPAVSGEVRVLIARFAPPGQVWSEELARGLEIPPSGQERILPGWGFRGSGGSILLSGSPRGSSLVLSRYSANPS